MGLFYGSVISILIFFFGAFLFTESNEYFSGSVTFGLIAMIHFNRKDGPFLKHYFSGKKYVMLMTEYFVISLVYLVACIIHQNWLVLTVFMAGLLLIPILKTGISSENWQNIPLPFSSCAAGLLSGFRIWYPVCILCLILIYLTALLGKQDVSLVLIWVYVIIVSGLQPGGDPLFYVRMSRSPGFYIRKKLVSGIGDYFFLVAPLLGIILLPSDGISVKLGVAIPGGFFLYLINQLVYAASSNSRLLVLILQTLSLIVFVILYFEMSLLFVIGGLSLMVVMAASYRLKKDFVW
jgi:hypothetical protein